MAEIDPENATEGRFKAATGDFPPCPWCGATFQSERLWQAHCCDPPRQAHGHDGEIITFSGEVMLAGWAKSTSKAEPKATFFFSSDEDLAPLEMATIAKGKQAGQRYHMVLVEIGDDELPIPKPEQPKGGLLAKWAGMMCNDPEFWAWLCECNQECGEPPSTFNEEDARQSILQTCGIKSRRMLDHDTKAGWMFREHVMAPFSAWKKERTPAFLKHQID